MATDISTLNLKDFESIAWSRPENKRQASKVVILGGSKDHFADTSGYYQELKDITGIKLSLILPDYLSKLVGTKDPNIIFVEGHKTGGYFIRESSNQIIQIINGADTCLMSGEIGRSSETQQFIEHVVDSCKSQTVITESALNCFAENYLENLLLKEGVAICIDTPALTRLGKNIKFEKAFISNLGFAQKIDYLEMITKKYSATLVISDNDTIWCAKSGEVFYSKSPKETSKLISDITKWLSWNNKDPLRTILSTLTNK